MSDCRDDLEILACYLDFGLCLCQANRCVCVLFMFLCFLLQCGALGVDGWSTRGVD